MYSLESVATDALPPLAALSLLDIFPAGVVLLDQNRRVVQLNRLAEQILGNGDGLYLRHDELRATRSGENTRLRQLLEDAGSGWLDAGVSALPLLSVSRSSGHRALEVLVLPFYCATGSGLDVDPPKTLVLIRDPERKLADCQDWLKSLYGLTQVEASVAQRMAQGQSVDHLAEELHVQPNTIRVHLKHIYRKTRTGRQSELVNLLTSDFLLHIPVAPRDTVVLSA